MGNLQDKAIKSIFWVGAIRYSGQLISWTVTILLIRILSPEDYGLMGMALAYKFLISIFFDLSIGEAILQKKTITEEDINTAFWICLSFAIVLYSITWFFANYWAYFFSNNALIKIVRVIGISVIILSIKEIPNRLLARKFEFKKRSLFELIASFACLGTSLIMALAGYGVWSLIIGELVKDFVLAFLILVYSKWAPKLQFSFSSATQLLRYGIPITGHYILNYISIRSDSIIIGKLLGQEILGYYTVALSLSRIPINKGIQIIQGVMFPLFSKIQGDTAECRRYYYKIIYVIAVIFFPVFFGMFAISKEIIVLILSPKWLPSLLSFRVFCIIGILLSFTGVFMVICKSRGNTTAVFKYSVYSAILLPSCLFISSNYGLTGIALCWLFIFPCLFVYMFYAVVSEIGVSIFESFRKVSNAFIGSLLMVAVVFLIKTVVLKNIISFGGLALNITVGGLVYTGYFYLFSKNTFQDIRTIWKSLRS